MINSEQYRHKVLDYTALSGEVRTKDLLMLGLSREYLHRLVSDLTESGLVKQDVFNKYKTIRLTNIGKKYMMRTYPSVYDKLFTGNIETNKIRTEYSRRDRNLKLAQTKVMLGQVGVNIHTANKPLLANDIISHPADCVDCEDYNNQFYTSTEIKQRFAEFKQIRNSRALGILITKKSICIIYNAGDRLFRWCEEDEKYFRTIISTVINQRIYKNQKTIKNILIISDNQMVLRILESDGGNRNTNLRIDNSVPNIHTIMSGVSDELVLSILMDKFDYCEAVRSVVPAVNWNIRSTMMTGYDIMGNDVLAAFDMDIKAIDSFLRRLQLMRRQGVIYCFDFQKEYIYDYCKHICDIRTITQDEFIAEG